MRSKVLKIGTVLLACVCLISFMALPVSALSADEGFVFTSIKIGWSTVVSSSPNGYYSTSDVADADDVITFAGISGNATAAGYYRPIYIAGKAGTSASSYTVKVRFAGVYFHNVADDYAGWNSFTDYAMAYVNGVKPSNFQRYNTTLLDNTAYGGEFTFTVNSGASFNMLLYSGYNQYTASVHSYRVIIDVFKNDNTQEIIDNQNENAQEIIDAQQQATQEQTDELTNGWGGGEKMDDSAINDFSDAESAALGGKSDEDIQAEVDGALDGGTDTIDWTKAKRISNFFDTTLNTFGPDYKTLLVLSLTLGLAAFLTGRRYSQ